MENKIAELHIKAGLKCGKECTCGKKINYKSEESAKKSADSLNKKTNRPDYHELEAYPCAFCGGWHIGRKMSMEELIELSINKSGDKIMNKEILIQNKASWDAIADDWFGATALPVYGPLIPTEDDLHLFSDVKGNKVLDIGCGSGHSLKWQGDRRAAELWGLDLSTRQLENAKCYLEESGYIPKLFNSPMEADCGLPKNYFDIVYSIYAIGWTTDLQKTFDLIASYLKKDGVFIFSWDHPLMHSVDIQGENMVFNRSYFEEGLVEFEKGGRPISMYKRKLSTYINALAKAGFKIENLIEETDKDTLERECEFSSRYYSPNKAKKFPVSFIIKARKL